MKSKPFLFVAAAALIALVLAPFNLAGQGAPTAGPQTEAHRHCGADECPLVTSAHDGRRGGLERN